MALFESYERRIDKINEVLNSYGIASLEEAEKITKDAGLDVYNQIKGIQPICFENACWAYITGAAIAIKKGCTRAADAAAAIGEGLQAFCIPGSVADQRKVGLGHGNLGKMLLEEETDCFAFLAGHESFAAAEGAIGIAEKANSQEFADLFNSFNEMADSLKKMRIEAYDRQLREQRDELKMLRAQLRPHFYLNAITTVSNMTYQNRNEDIRKYLAALAKYMRYMLNIQNKWVRIAEEIEQVKSYLEMQKIKFPGSVDAYIGCADSVADTRVPYLLLFTAVENSFKHAMSLYEPLWLVVQCEHYQDGDFCGCRMIVEDNGKGFPQEVISMFSLPEEETPRSAKDHLGLTNISRTLQLIYHRNDLLRLSNAKTGGAHVEIWIPEENDEAADL